jgi:hypothetical protein
MLTVTAPIREAQPCTALSLLVLHFSAQRSGRDKYARRSFQSALREAMGRASHFSFTFRWAVDEQKSALPYWLRMRQATLLTHLSHVGRPCSKAVKAENFPTYYCMMETAHSRCWLCSLHSLRQQRTWLNRTFCAQLCDGAVHISKLNC